MRIPIRFVPGWKQLALLAAPIGLGLAFVVGAYLYNSAASAATPTMATELPKREPRSA